MATTITKIRRQATPNVGSSIKDIHRGSARNRGYDTTWDKLRAIHIAKHPLCVLCEAHGTIRLGTEVDHITPIHVAPQRRLDPTNLQTLCHPHHVRKTHAEGEGHHAEG